MITREDIESVAILSKLFVAEEDLDTLTNQMQEIVNFADEIANAPVEEIQFDNINNLSNVFREDEIMESYKSDEILKNAPQQANSHFLVKAEE